MAGALRLLLIGCLLQGSLCKTFSAFMPQTIEVLIGSCVTIPCSFDIEDKYKLDLDNTCTGIWKIGSINGDDVFGTSDTPTQQTKQRLNGELTGNVTQKECTTTLNNMPADYSGKYFFRLQCKNRLKWKFSAATVNIVVKAAPPRPTLTPPRLEVKEGSSVSLSCSVAAPCPSHPPTLTWTHPTGLLGNSQEILKENRDKTTVMTSVLTFTASHLHDGQTIACTALYSRKLSAETNSTVSILYPPRHPSVSASPSGPVLEGSAVTLACRSDANPAVDSYTWYRVDGDQKRVVGSENSLTLNNIDRKKKGPYLCEVKNVHGEANATVLLDVVSTCHSNANPAVENRVNGTGNATVETGHNFTINKIPIYDRGEYYCNALDKHAVVESVHRKIDATIAPEILSSSGCIRTAAQINCSCEAVGKPPPILEWQLDGIPVNHSDKFTVRHEPLRDRGLRSFITMNQPQGKDLSTLVCHSTNSVGSASHQFCVHSLEAQKSLEGQGQVPLPLFIATVAVLTAVLVCALVFAIRAQKTRHNPAKGQTTVHTGTVVASQVLTNGVGNEVPTMPEEDIYMNSKVLRGAGEPNKHTFNKQHLEASHPGPKPLSSSKTISETNRTNLPRSEPHDANGPSKSAEKKNVEDSDVLYSTVIWKIKKSMKRGEDPGDVQPPGSSYLQEERWMLGNTGRNCLSKTWEMENLFDELGPRRDAEKDCEYTQVKFKTKNTMDK